MLVKWIEMPGKNEVYHIAKAVRAVFRDVENPLLTRVQLDVMTPQGFLSVLVLDNPDELARRINATLAGRDLLSS